MSPHQTVALALRLFAIWLAIYVAREMLAFYVAGNRQGDEYSPLIVAVISVLAIIFLLVLWFFPRTIAQGLLPSSSDAPPPPASPETWFTVGCGLLGLWVMASAVPHLLRNLIVLYLYRSYEMDKSSLRDGLVYYIVELVIGVSLIVGASGIRKFIWWARNAGHG